MYKRLDPLISASRGTLVGDLLWLAAIGFILAIVTGLIGRAAALLSVASPDP